MGSVGPVQGAVLKGGPYQKKSGSLRIQVGAKVFFCLWTSGAPEPRNKPQPPKECWLSHVCTGGRQNKAQKKMWLVNPPPLRIRAQSLSGWHG